jgi:hypothetical protein
MYLQNNLGLKNSRTNQSILQEGEDKHWGSSEPQKFLLLSPQLSL